MGTLGFSIVMPFLVFLVTSFGGNAIIYGIIGAVYPFFQLFGAPLLGKWSDIYGRKKILFLSQAGTVAGWLIFLASAAVPLTVLFTFNSELLGVFSVTIPLIFVFAARAIDGLTGGNISVANAYLADITDEKNRNRNFGKMSVSSNLGFIAGPALAGLLGATSHGYVIPIIAALVLSAITLVLIQFYLPDTGIKQYTEKPDDIKKVLGFENKECYRIEGEKKAAKSKILDIPNIKFILVIYFLIFLAFNFYYTSFPVHAIEKLNWTVGEMGIYFSVLSILMVIVQGPVLSRLSKKVTESVLIITGNLFLVITFLMLLSGNSVIVFSSALFFAAGNGIMWPSVLSVLSKAAGKTFQGTVQGYASSLGSLASIIGLILGGIIYSAIGAYTFVISASVIFLVAALSFRFPAVLKECPVNDPVLNS
ncbi:MAG: Major facilitator superfamily permease [Chlorobi bacterium OLB5]|nr:MAG: Major facilitator superfamily permease [Chlorobi bacterium OLB5]